MDEIFTGIKCETVDIICPTTLGLSEGRSMPKYISYDCSLIDLNPIKKS